MRKLIAATRLIQNCALAKRNSEIMNRVLYDIVSI
jgi:hypothetical protein